MRRLLLKGFSSCVHAELCMFVWDLRGVYFLMNYNHTCIWWVMLALWEVPCWINPKMFCIFSVWLLCLLSLLTHFILFLTIFLSMLTLLYFWGVATIVHAQSKWELILLHLANWIEAVFFFKYENFMFRFLHAMCIHFTGIMLFVGQKIPPLKVRNASCCSCYSGYVLMMSISTLPAYCFFAFSITPLWS